MSHHDNKSYESISPVLSYIQLKNRFREIALNDSMVNFADYSELKKLNNLAFQNKLKIMI